MVFTTEGFLEVAIESWPECIYIYIYTYIYLYIFSICHCHVLTHGNIIITINITILQ